MIKATFKKYLDQRLKTQKDMTGIFLQYFTDAYYLNKADNYSPNSIYQSVSFSAHENYTEEYEKERNFVTRHIRNLGWDIYSPYEKTDPGAKSVFKRFARETTTDHKLTAREILDLDFGRILNSEVLLLDYNLSSNGIGQEAQVAFFIPKIVYTRKRPTMLTGGLPGTLNLFYESKEELKELLTGIFCRKSYEEEPFSIREGNVYKGDTCLNDKYKDNLWVWK